jgi:hypothetical protein
MQAKSCHCPKPRAIPVRKPEKLPTWFVEEHMNTPEVG